MLSGIQLQSYISQIDYPSRGQNCTFYYTLLVPIVLHLIHEQWMVFHIPFGMAGNIYCSQLPHHQLRPILQRLCQMHRLDRVTSRQIRDGA
jgi:hypothetical protein